MTRPRWKLLLWPLVVIVFVEVAGLVWIWSTGAAQRQDQVVKSFTLTFAASVLGGLWLVTWLLLLSRLAWRARWIGLASLLGLGAILGGLLEVRGVTGDVVPIVGWRWSHDPGAGLPIAASPSMAPGDRPVSPEDTSGADYPQFLGPGRDGVLHGIRLAREWPERPSMLWRQPVGVGWSAFSVVGERAVTQEQRGEQEVVSCYHLPSGALLWIHTDDTRFSDPVAGPGPRATPTIVDSVVYTLGATGLLNALELETGARLWSRNVIEETGARIPTYGVSASPIVVGDTVVAVAGGVAGSLLVAYDRLSGEPRWAGGDDGASYGSPILTELLGLQQIVVLGSNELVGLDPSSGELLWRFPWPAQENTTQPVVLPGDRLFLSSGYGFGGRLLELRRESSGSIAVDVVWESLALKAKFTNVVHRDGFLYGLDDGILTCVDVERGERRWKAGRYGHGQIILVEDLILVLGEQGIVALVEADPAAFRERAAFPALDGKTWNHPALAGRYLVVRNDREAACYELPLEPG